MRKDKPKPRYWLPDPIYNDPMVTRFVNNLMVDGKKSISYEIFYDALKIIEEKTEEKGIDVWRRALQNVMPTLEVKSRRLGGANFQVPTEVRPNRKITLAIRWMIKNTRKRTEKSMKLKLASEIILASKNEGATIKKKEDTHKMAEANKAFSHFRF